MTRREGVAVIVFVAAKTEVKDVKILMFLTPGEISDW